MTTVGVLGSSGFVGSAVVAAFRSSGVDVRPIATPRLDVRFGTDPVVAAAAWARACPGPFAELVAAADACDVVVNAAGLAAPTDPATGALWGANAVLPAVVVLAARSAGVPLVVHVSSAAVQGSVAVLDEAPFVHGQTPYASAKGAGERAVLDDGGRGVVVYRPTSVLGVGRPIAARLASVLSSKLLVVPPEDPPLPVALVQNVGAAVVAIAGLADPPPILLHPWEGMTVSSLAAAFGRDTPLRRLPAPVATPLRWVVRQVVQHGRGLAGKVRRVEMLWEGQEQRSSMPALGFSPVDQDAAYRELGRLLAEPDR